MEEDKREGMYALSDGLREIVTQDPDGKIVVDADGRVLFANPAVKQILNRDPESMTGHLFGFPIVPWGFSEIEFITKDGGAGQAELHVAAIKWGQQEAFLVSLRDVTGRRYAEEELLNRNATLSVVFENTPNILMLVDIDGRVTDINRAGTQLVGKTKEELLGLLGGDVFGCLNSFRAPGCGKNKECNDCPIRSRVMLTLETQKPIFDEEGQFEIIRDGKKVTLHILVSTAPVKTPRGKQVLVTITDISERYNTENAVRESENKYRSLMKDMPSGVYIVQNDRIVFANARTEELTGYSIKELKSMNGFNLIHTEDREKIRELTRLKLNGEKVPSAHSLRMIRKDGTVIWLRRRTATTDWAGAPATLIMDMDITARMQAEEALVSSERRFRELFELMREGVCIHELIYDDSSKVVDYRIIDANPAFQSILGLKVEKVRGRNASKVYGTGYPPYLETYERVATLGNSEAFETYFAPLNKYFDISCFSPCKGQFVTVFSDSTERKLAESKLHDFTAELEKRNMFIQTIIDKLPIGLAINNMGDGKVTYINDKFEEIYGWPKDDTLDINTFFDKVYPDPVYRSEIKGRVMSDIASGDPARMVWEDLTATTISGEKRIISAVNIPIADQGIMVSTVRDVTKQKKAEEAIQQSERDKATIISNLPGMVYRCRNDQNWTMEYLSDGCQALTGYLPEQLLNSEEFGYNELILPEDRDEVWNKTQDAISQHRSFELNYRIIAANGETRYVWERGTGIWSENGELKHLEGFISDVTKLIRTESALIESEKRYRELYEQSPAAYQSLDINGNIIEVNKAWLDAMGYEREEVIGRWFGDFIVPEGVAQFRASFPRFRKASKIHSEYWLKHKNGGTRLLAFDGRIGHDMKGDFKRTHCIIQDITEKHKANEAIKTAAEEWRTTFDSIKDMVALIDLHHTIVRVNKAFASTLKQEPNDLVGKQCYEVIHNMNQPHPMCPHARMLESKHVESSEYFDKKLKMWVEASSSPIFDKNGSLTGSVHIIKDISERKREEQQTQQLRTKAEMSSRLAAVGEMAAGIAHEINNPLTGVIGFSELLMERNDLPKDVLENIEIINDGSQRVKEIVKRMLTFARQAKPQKNSISITELIDNTLELRGYVLKTSNIEVVKDYAPGLPWVMADAGQLQQVFLNIIVNAEYAMKKAHDRGVLTIKTEYSDGHIRVSIKDDGQGLPESVKAKLFQPFFTTKDPGEGTGLGLSLSLGIIQEHGGKIMVESEYGHGVNFIIELPIGVIETVPAEELEIVPVIEKAKSARLLIVDDEPAIRTLLKKILKQEGHEVTECSLPETAIEKIGQSKYDLIFLDVRMPGMSGIELFDKISRLRPEYTHRVIFITGDTSDLITREYLIQHQIPFVDKPFDRKTLLDKINEALSYRLNDRTS
ncbi:sensory box sensor histidine kinase-response regulator [Dehalogenimonas sp. WBC-2]|nr:sensory box sensor histidine kinase-response regulator [Dehalogenimonas sp. WBC-2]